jgi:addiction module HigA family antidote
MLLKEFLVPAGLSQMDLARGLGVPIQRINTIVNEKRAVSAETALLLGQAFRTTPEFWLNLQMMYDLWHARHQFKKKVRPLPRKRVAHKVHLKVRPRRGHRAAAANG